MTHDYVFKKCLSIIEQIERHGFLRYLVQFLDTGQCRRVKELTKSEFVDRWVEDDLFEMDSGLIWDTTGNKKWQSQDVFPATFFFETFMSSYCIPITFETIDIFVDMTRDEYKNSWFIDRNKHVIYFRFRHVCGEGSSKKTYLGWNVTDHIPVVVYQIHVSGNQTDQKRYLNEKRIAEIEKSPYLLTIHFSTTSKETRKIFMIANFCQYNVRQMILDRYCWTMDDLKLFTRHILKGLKVLHDMNIIHRDVKPSNIMYDDKVKLYKLIDFGIATKFTSGIQLNKIETLNQYDQLSLVGTPGYISPEMYDSLYTLKKTSYTVSVDIFSFGITLLEMCLGDRAFRLDFEKLPHMIENDIHMKETTFRNGLYEESLHLKNMFSKVDDVLKKKRLEVLRSQIQEKIDIVQQLNVCDSDERDMLLSELIDKNKTIFHCCQKIPQSLHDIHEKSNIEYELLSKLNALHRFAGRMHLFSSHPMDDLLNDYQFYPVLFILSSYEYPASLDMIHDDVLKDFLRSCLEKSPLNRLSITQLLNHPWLQE
jgi:serine/threonine protein kinase